MDVIKYK